MANIINNYTQQNSIQKDVIIDQSVTTNDWQSWRELTQARIAIGRVGAALPTQEILSFGLAHAQACDAIHTPLDIEQLSNELKEQNWQVEVVHSQADVQSGSRETYLRRPDLGRKLADDCKKAWFDSSNYSNEQTSYDLVFMVGDGLSSLAVQTQVVPLLNELKTFLNPNLIIAPVFIAKQARVALGDAVGELVNAKMVVVLIGERPGLSAADSLGVYMTYAPKTGKKDAERNCISNIRPGGLSSRAAAFKLNWLITQAFERQLTGVNLKDESDNFLKTMTVTVTAPMPLVRDKKIVK
nr:ethanolamine ammonia-lyase subunit EutC [Moraxella sp. CTOTU48717]